MKKIPDILVVFDIHREEIAVKEAKVLGLPIVGIADTNSNPDGIDYLIPANDDSVKSIDYLLNKFAEAYKPGKPEPKKVTAKDTNKSEVAK